MGRDKDHQHTKKTIETNSTDKRDMQHKRRLSLFDMLTFIIRDINKKICREGLAPPYFITEITGLAGGGDIPAGDDSLDGSVNTF